MLCYNMMHISESRDDIIAAGSITQFKRCYTAASQITSLPHVNIQTPKHQVWLRSTVYSILLLTSLQQRSYICASCWHNKHPSQNMYSKAPTLSTLCPAYMHAAVCVQNTTNQVLHRAMTAAQHAGQAKLYHIKQYTSDVPQTRCCTIAAQHAGQPYSSKAVITQLKPPAQEPTHKTKLQLQT
jgi:hypothetical protein